MEVKNYLLGYKNIYIYQNPNMFSFSLDSVLLPNFISIPSNPKRILDIGTGNAPIPLILSTKTTAKITGIEIQPDVYELAKKSIEENKLEEKIEVICADVKEWYKNIESETFDIITCNPPFFKMKATSNVNKSDYKTIARHELCLNLEQLLKISRKILKNNGIIGIVHRPERFVDIVEEMRKNNIEPKKIRFVYPKLNEEANVLLIEGKKNGKPGIKILPPLYVHNEDGKYTAEVLKYFE